MQAKPWSPGEQFGRLTLTGPEVRVSVRNHRAVWCQCECGKDVVVALDKLRSGYTRSCGCLRAEVARGTVDIAHEAKRGMHIDMKPVSELGKAGLHTRLKRDRGLASAGTCTYADNSCRGQMEWASISRQYLGVEDFMILCKSHHVRYDRLVRNLKRPWG